ncbi:MAG TPA: hypothetical protein VMW08_00715 [Acidimicrobiales bacterium]|nr:hypothetical protein [Acidimicrobiales bacterium]
MADIAQLAERQTVKVTADGTIISGTAHLAAAAITGAAVRPELGTRDQRIDAGEHRCLTCGALAWDETQDFPGDGHTDRDWPLTHGPVVNDECDLCRVGRLELEADDG